MQNYFESYINNFSNDEFLSSKNIAMFVRISQLPRSISHLVTSEHLRHRVHAYTCDTWDRARIKKERLSFPQAKLSDYGGFESERSKIERNVERVKIRTGRTVHLDGWEGRTFDDYRTQVREFPLAVSPSYHSTSVYRGKRTMRSRWVPLRSSSIGVPRRPQGSQGEGTSHAPTMSEKSTPLRRGVHTLTRPISIRA